MAGPRPWRFTQFILSVLSIAVVLGYLLVMRPTLSPGQILFAAALASTASAGGVAGSVMVV
jgi:uncharacterized membrane protein